MCNYRNTISLTWKKSPTSDNDVPLKTAMEASFHPEIHSIARQVIEEISADRISDEIRHKRVV